ncbi:hypothetical protein A2U01_0058513 [Trifolium medium]|uniref:Pentatricopeptide repeat-containing protein n=1 Tax=Trifolium medium TaxID=97028 RepID=A0A392RLW2_9FABA|nr:hypothetical protein [Trifolium medium]
MVNQWILFVVFDEMRRCDVVGDETTMLFMLFEGLQVKDTVSWISLIAGYEKHGDGLKFLNFSVKCSGKVELPTK